MLIAIHLGLRAAKPWKGDRSLSFVNNQKNLKTGCHPAPISIGAKGGFEKLSFCPDDYRGEG